MPDPIRAVGLAVALAVFTLTLPCEVSAQFVDEYFQPIVALPDSGTYSPEVQRSIEEGYRMLDLVSDPSDDEHLEPAKEAFDRALELDDRAVHAWVGKGIYELRKDEGWLILLESLKKILDRDHISMAIKAFERALALEPDFLPARYDLALAYRQRRGEQSYRAAIEELRRIVEEAPEFGSAPMLLGLTYRDLGDLEGMRRAISELPTSEAFPEAAKQLLLAYASINSDRIEEGVEAYWGGVDAIASEQSANLFWHDVRPIATPETHERFTALPLAEKTGFLRDYWQRIADQSFVTADERVAEHYRRLHHVIRNYRLELPERRHYSRIAAYVPPWQTGFDDRGDIYLRHGPPDDEAVHSAPGVERNISWKYERDGRDPLLFHFVSDQDNRDFKLVRRLSDAVLSSNASLQGRKLLDPNTPTNVALSGTADPDDVRILEEQRVALQDLYRSRGHLDPDYNRAAMNLDRFVLEEEESELAEDIAFATRTQSYAPEPPAEPFLFPVRAVPFKNPGGRNVVSFYFAIPTRQVTILPRGSGSGVDFRYQLRVTPAGSPETSGRAEEEVHLSTPSPLPTGPGVAIPRVETVSLASGEYGYGMKIVDLNSGRFGILQGDVTLHDFSRSGLSLSGVVLANRVEEAPNRISPFVRWGRYKVLPLPSGMFRREQAVFVYYEVYGLAPEEGGEVRYRTTYTLRARDRDRNVVAKFFSAVGELLTGGEERGSITYSFERSRAQVEDPLLEYISLDLSESEPGDYTLAVEVENLATREVQRSEAPLTLVP